MSNLTSISECADKNQEILQAIIHNCLYMFENIDYGQRVSHYYQGVLSPKYCVPIVACFIRFFYKIQTCKIVCIENWTFRKIQRSSAHVPPLTWTSLSLLLSSLSETGVRWARPRGIPATSPLSRRSKDSSQMTNSRFPYNIWIHTLRENKQNRVTVLYIVWKYKMQTFLSSTCWQM